MKPTVLNRTEVVDKAMRSPLAQLMHLKVRVMDQINEMEKWESGNPISTTKMQAGIKNLMEAWSRYKDQFGWLWDQDLEADYYALHHCYSEAFEFGLGALNRLKEKAAKTIQVAWRRY